MSRPRSQDYDSLKETLIEKAGNVLAEEGIGALTTRRVAKDAGASTTAVYTLFQDKAGLLDAMYRTGFQRLAARFADIPSSDDPVDDLIALGEAYRQNALANPHLYDLMFSRPVPGFVPSQSAEQQVTTTFTKLIETVRRCMEGGWIRSSDPDDVASHLNGLVHGLASLEIQGRLGSAQDADRRWRSALGTTIDGYRPSSVRPDPNT